MITIFQVHFTLSLFICLFECKYEFLINYYQVSKMPCYLETNLVYNRLKMVKTLKRKYFSHGIIDRGDAMLWQSNILFHEQILFVERPSLFSPLEILRHISL